MAKGNNPQFSVRSSVPQVPGLWGSFCLIYSRLSMLITHIHAHTWGDERRGLTRGEIEWEPSVMFAREKPLD